MQESETSVAKVLYLFILFFMCILSWFSSDMETATFKFDVKTSVQGFKALKSIKKGLLYGTGPFNIFV